MGMKQKPPSARTLLETFWRREPFHDSVVESIIATKQRLILRLSCYTLVITHVSKFTKEIEELPTVWLYERWTERDCGFTLHVDLELGTFEVTGRDLRLIRNHDLAILIPPIDT